MNQVDLFKKLGLILNELNEQYQFLAENPQQLSELELELFHANANFLADHVQIIKKINLSQQPPLILAPADEHVSTDQSADLNEMEQESQVETIAFAEEPQESEPPVAEEHVPVAAEIEEELFKLDQSPSTFEFILNDHAEHERFEFEEKSVDELFNRPLSEEEEQILARKKSAVLSNPEVMDTDEDEIGPEPFLVPTKEEFPITPQDLDLEIAPVTATEINREEPVEDPSYKPTLNELLAKSSSGSVNQNTGVEVKDLKQAINLNDKLLYIKDLFNGYNLAYAEAIEVANKLPNFEAADNFFKKNYAVKNNWSAKQETVDKFYQLLNQRFKA